MHADASALAARTSVVILTRDRCARLSRSIEAALALDPPAAEVVVVDNASSDGTTQILASLAGRVRTIRNDTNLGAGEGRNRGARAAKGDVLMFLDDDILVPPDTFAKLAASNAVEPGVLVTGLVLDGPRRLPVIGHDIGAISGHVRAIRPTPGLPDVVDVALVGANFLLIPRADFEALGGFDESLFIPYEDSDLCARAHERGGRVRCVTNLTVVHDDPARLSGFVAARTPMPPARAYYIARNRIIFQRRHHPGAPHVAFLLLALPLLTLANAAAAIAAWDKAALTATLRGTLAGLRTSPPTPSGR